MQWPTGKLEVSAKTANVGWLYLIEIINYLFIERKIGFKL
jgi:hypothetical protein